MRANPYISTPIKEMCSCVRPQCLEAPLGFCELKNYRPYSQPNELAPRGGCGRGRSDVLPPVNRGQGLLTSSPSFLDPKFHAELRVRVSRGREIDPLALSRNQSSRLLFIASIFSWYDYRRPSFPIALLVVRSPRFLVPLS